MSVINLRGHVEETVDVIGRLYSFMNIKGEEIGMNVTTVELLRIAGFSELIPKVRKSSKRLTKKEMNMLNKADRKAAMTAVTIIVNKCNECCEEGESSVRFDNKKREWTRFFKGDAAVRMIAEKAAGKLLNTLKIGTKRVKKISDSKGVSEPIQIKGIKLARGYVGIKAFTMKMLMCQIGMNAQGIS